MLHDMQTVSSSLDSGQSESLARACMHILENGIHSESGRCVCILGI